MISAISHSPITPVGYTASSPAANDSGTPNATTGRVTINVHIVSTISAAVASSIISGSTSVALSVITYDASVLIGVSSHVSADTAWTNRAGITRRRIITYI